MTARAVAFYLPQFHPIPENDEWWGRGFTEWTNVAKAAPLFAGHCQPHIPGDLGFYDLRVPETRAAQAEMAKAHGIEGFCYWHYWFEGRRLLERPFEEVLRSRDPDFPFCLSWANESWSRRWLGEERSLLVKQTYSREDDRRHARWLAQVFADPRYLHVKGRPLFSIYRPGDLPDPVGTTDLLRGECVRQGLPEPYLVGIDAHRPGVDWRPLGFDDTLAFEPQLSVLPDFMTDCPTMSKTIRNLRRGILSPRLKVYADPLARKLMLASLRPSAIPCVFVGWDNTPRRGANGIIIDGGTPETFLAALEDRILSLSEKPMDERLVFLNAWNEWAEGNHLEPDLRHGTRYLEAVRSAVTMPRATAARRDV